MHSNLALVLISSSLIGLAQKPSLVMRSGQAYFGRLEANVEGSIVVTPKRKAPDQSESSGLPQTCTAYNSPMTIFSWLQIKDFQILMKVFHTYESMSHL